MGTHFHLLVESTSADLAAAMRHLNGRYAQRFNDRHERRGHVFAQRYSAYVLRDEQHLEDATAYIAANPAQAGLCDNGGRLALDLDRRGTRGTGAQRSGG